MIALTILFKFRLLISITRSSSPKTWSCRSILALVWKDSFYTVLPAFPINSGALDGGTHIFAILVSDPELFSHSSRNRVAASFRFSVFGSSMYIRPSGNSLASISYLRRTLVTLDYRFILSITSAFEKWLIQFRGIANISGNADSSLGDRLLDLCIYFITQKIV